MKYIFITYTTKCLGVYVIKSDGILHHCVKDAIYLLLCSIKLADSFINVNMILYTLYCEAHCGDFFIVICTM